MYMWSYRSTNGVFQHPGPVLCVTEGDVVIVHLTNNMDYGLTTSMAFPGQVGVTADGAAAQPDLANASLTDSVAFGDTITYSFTAGRPGTFIYESGTNPQTQVTMGLFGALIVRPYTVEAGGFSLDPANYVYNSADSEFTSTTADNEEYMALLSEIDPYQHEAWKLGLVQGQAYNLNNYRARYWMINGRGFPDSIADNYAPWLPAQPYGALARIYPNSADHLLPAVERFINVGTEEYPFHPHGQNGLVIGRDGYPLKGAGNEDLAFEKFDVNIGPGQTWDVIFKWHDAEQYSESNPIQGITMPDLANIAIGMFYSGSPYLGVQETMPPGASTLNQCGEYYIISHNHALFQIDAFGQVMSGPITYLRIDPPITQQQATGLMCP